VVVHREGVDHCVFYSRQRVPYPCVDARVEGTGAAAVVGRHVNSAEIVSYFGSASESRSLAVVWLVQDGRLNEVGVALVPFGAVGVLHQTGRQKDVGDVTVRIDPEAC
jgi:hypothetical protein